MHELIGSTELDGMFSHGVKGIIVALKRVPAIQIGRQAAHPAWHGGQESGDIDDRGVSAGERSQRSVFCGRIESRHAGVVIDAFMVVAEAQRVHKCGSETMCFFHRNDLPGR